MAPPNASLIRYLEPLTATGTSGSRQKITGIILPVNSGDFQVSINAVGDVAVVATGYQEDGSGNRTHLYAGVELTAADDWQTLVSSAGGTAVFTVWVTNLAGTEIAFSCGKYVSM